jgi:hypothetical protein
MIVNIVYTFKMFKRYKLVVLYSQTFVSIQLFNMEYMQLKKLSQL